MFYNVFERDEMSVATLNATIIEKISSKNPTVADIVVDRLVEQEIQKRAETLTNAIKTYKDTEKLLQKVKPDVETYAVDGTVQSSGFTKQKLEEKSKKPFSFRAPSTG